MVRSFFMKGWWPIRANAATTSTPNSKVQPQQCHWRVYSNNRYTDKWEMRALCLLTLHCAAEWTPSSPQPELLLSWLDLVCWLCTADPGSDLWLTVNNVRNKTDSSNTWLQTSHKYLLSPFPHISWCHNIIAKVTSQLVSRDVGEERRS